MHGIRLLAAFPALFACATFAATPAVPPAPTVVGHVEIAPFATLVAQAGTLGRQMGNPILPALLVASAQQTLATSYVPVRNEQPFYYVFCAKPGALPENVAVLPATQGVAQFALNHPGSMRRGEDAVALPPDAEVRRAVFDAADGYAAFADADATARTALSHTARMRKAGAGANAPLAKMHLDLVACDAFAATWLSLVAADKTKTAEKLVRDLDAALTLTDQALTLALVLRPRDGVTPARLRADLEKTVAAIAFGADEGFTPKYAYATTKAGVSLTITLSAGELKKAGRSFNAAIMKTMAPPQKASKTK